MPKPIHAFVFIWFAVSGIVGTLLGNRPPETQMLLSAAEDPIGAPQSPTPSPTPKPTPSPTPKPTASPTPTPPPSVQERIAASWPGNDQWALDTVECETGGTWDFSIHSRSGKYHGGWQFSLATWRSVGGPGDPHEHSVETQTQYAWKLYQRSGPGQWPVCGR